MKPTVDAWTNVNRHDVFSWNEHESNQYLPFFMLPWHVFMCSGGCYDQRMSTTTMSKVFLDTYSVFGPFSDTQSWPVSFCTMTWISLNRQSETGPCALLWWEARWTRVTIKPERPSLSVSCLPLYSPLHIHSSLFYFLFFSVLWINLVCPGHENVKYLKYTLAK